MAAKKKAKVGDNVIVRWGKSQHYIGKCVARKGNKIEVKYTDGDEGWTQDGTYVVIRSLKDSIDFRVTHTKMPDGYIDKSTGEAIDPAEKKRREALHAPEPAEEVGTLEEFIAGRSNEELFELIRLAHAEHYRRVPEVKSFKNHVARFLYMGHTMAGVVMGFEKGTRDKYRIWPFGMPVEFRITVGFDKVFIMKEKVDRKASGEMDGRSVRRLTGVYGDQSEVIRAVKRKLKG
jgi:hypothetical protein